MFNRFRKKKLVSNDEVTMKETAVAASAIIKAPDEAEIPSGAVLHYCYMLSPEAFQMLTKRSKLTYEQWYRAIWFIQHTEGGLEKLTIQKLASYIGTSWPTADNAAEKIIKLLKEGHL